MRLLLALLFTVHGAIHLLGVVKGFSLAPVRSLVLPISRPLGALWLLAAILCFATVVALFASPPCWWTVGAVAIAVSQSAIATSWSDAKFGTLANLLALAGVALAFLEHGPWSAHPCGR